MFDGYFPKVREISGNRIKLQVDEVEFDEECDFEKELYNNDCKESGLLKYSVDAVPMFAASSGLDKKLRL